jgi:hypothetical protein
VKARKAKAVKPRRKKAAQPLRRVDVPLIDLVREAIAQYAARGLELHPLPMPTTTADTSILVSAIHRAQHELSRLAESLCEGDDDVPLGELARAIGSLVTAEREAKGIGGTLETDDDDATESSVSS